MTTPPQHAQAPTAVDQSFTSISPTYAAANGIRVVYDYLSHSPSKDWTAAQVKAFHASGVACGFLWETTANRALGGYAAGLADGGDAGDHLTALIAEVGYAPTRAVAIIAAVDFDTTTNTAPTVIAYMQGFRAGLRGRFLTGAYGEADIIDRLGAIIDVAFQTYAWSGGRLSARADLYQYLNGQTLGGATVDFDRIIDDANLGAWWPAGHEPAGSADLIGDDLLADERQWLIDTRAAVLAGPKSFVTITVQNAPSDPRNFETWLVRDGYGEKITSSDWLAYFAGKLNVGQQIVVSSGDELDTWLRRYGAIGSTPDVIAAALTGVLQSLSALSVQVAALPTAGGGTVIAEVDMVAVKAAIDAAVTDALAKLNLVLALGRAA